MTEIKKQECRVSVIMPVYNVEKYLPECFESVDRQTYKNFELIIIDDGSTDNSPQLCDLFCIKHSYAKVIHSTNNGVSCARNNGLDLAEGDYIVFIDSDDVLSEFYLEELVNLMAISRGEMAMVGYTSEDMCELSYSINTTRTYQVSSDYIFDNIIRNNKIGGYLWNKIFNRSIIENYNIRFLDGVAIWEDVYFVLQYLSKIENIIWCKYKYYFYRKRESSAVMDMTLEKKFNKISIAKRINEYHKDGCEQFHEDARRSYLRTYFDYCWNAFKQKKLSQENKQLFFDDFRNLNGKTFFSKSEKVKIFILKFGI